MSAQELKSQTKNPREETDADVLDRSLASVSAKLENLHTQVSSLLSQLQHNLPAETAKRDEEDITNRIQDFVQRVDRQSDVVSKHSKQNRHSGKNRGSYRKEAEAGTLRME